MFDLTPAKGSTFLSGLTSAQFTARPRTTSKLEAVDSSLYFSNGDLLGGFFGSDGIYDPQPVPPDGDKVARSTCSTAPG